jgi:hypothetical protein
VCHKNIECGTKLVKLVGATMCQGIIIRIKNQKIVTNEQEIRSLLQYFLKRVQYIFEIYLKDTNKRARNMKLASIFFKASAENVFTLIYGGEKNNPPVLFYGLFALSLR